MPDWLRGFQIAGLLVGGLLVPVAPQASIAASVFAIALQVCCAKPSAPPLTNGENDGA